MVAPGADCGLSNQSPSGRDPRKGPPPTKKRSQALGQHGEVSRLAAQPESNFWDNSLFNGELMKLSTVSGSSSPRKTFGVYP